MIINPEYKRNGPLYWCLYEVGLLVFLITVIVNANNWAFHAIQIFSISRRYSGNETDDKATDYGWEK